MNKLYILAGLTMLSVASVSAEEIRNDMMRTVPATRAIPAMRVAEAGKGMASGSMMKMPSTGDPLVDAQLKALNVEMETKIKAIHDEYGAKILAILKEKMIKSGATSTPREMMRGSSMNATSTQEHGMRKGMMMRPDGEGRGNGKVLGDSYESKENQPADSFFGNFFRGIFGR